MPALGQLRARLRSKRKEKAVRVTAVSTDQLVPCPTCGGFMRLSDAHARFECKQCRLAIRFEGVLKSMDWGSSFA
jgi:tRNA(Ile2) C34 agmatinyltransferase TiaS